MPAQEFSGQTEDVLVLVTAPEGAFPEGTTMQVMMVEVDADTMSSVEEAVEGKVTVIQAVDISFYDAEGNKIEPLKPIQVSMKSALVSESENVSLIHKPDADKAAGQTLRGSGKAGEVEPCLFALLIELLAKILCFRYLVCP